MGLNLFSSEIEAGKLSSMLSFIEFKQLQNTDLSGVMVATVIVEVVVAVVVQPFTLSKINVYRNNYRVKN